MHQVSSKWRKPKKRCNRQRRNALNSKKQNKNKSQDKSTSEAIPTSADKSISATTRKFSLFESLVEKEASDQDSENSDNSFEESKNKDEYIMINTATLKELVENKVCCDCGGDSVNLRINNQYGCVAALQIECKSCSEVLTEKFSSSRYTLDKHKYFDLNNRMVQAFLKIGNGYSSLNEFNASFNMSSMSIKTYYLYLNQTLDKMNAFKQEILSKSRQIVRSVYAELYGAQENPVIDLFTSFDGSWHKKGFTSLYAIGCVVEVYTGLVVDYEILSKYCHMCTYTSNELGSDSPEFHIWYEGHKGECNKNFDGTSGAMEVQIADILWKRSVKESACRYTTILSDGDAKVFKHLTDEKIYDTPIEKEDCINHVKKRMGTALRNAVQTAKQKGKDLIILLIIYI